MAELAKQEGPPLFTGQVPDFIAATVPEAAEILLSQ